MSPACQTQPKAFSVATPGHFSSRWIVGVPLLRQPGVVGHRLALTKAATSAVTGGTDNVASNSCQIPCKVFQPGFPLMVPAAPVFAAWAAQPDVRSASMGEVSRTFARILGRVPPYLNETVVWVRQGFLPYLIPSRPCALLQLPHIRGICTAAFDIDVSALQCYFSNSSCRCTTPGMRLMIRIGWVRASYSTRFRNRQTTATAIT